MTIVTTINGYNGYTKTNDNSYNKHLLQWLQEIWMTIVTTITDYNGTTMTVYICYNKGRLHWY